jgi:hypothetical protein
MNRDPSEFDHPLQAREWQLQERAREDERSGRPTADADARLLRYRLIARELYRPLDAALPASMPDLVVANIEQEAQRRRRSVRRFRFWSLASPLLVFAACILMLTAVYGTQWLVMPDLGTGAGTLVNPWLLALLGCGALSGLLPTLPRHRMPGWN